MNRRKAILSKSAEYRHKRIEDGKPLPPSLRRGTPEYVKGRYWSTLNQRCSNGTHIQYSRRNKSYLEKGIELHLTKSEFDAWVDQHWFEFEKIYAEGRTPSIDRRDAAKHYDASNMQVIDLKENMRKDRIKAVIATNLFTSEITRYESARDAIGFDCKLISRACLTGTNHKGHSWKFA